MPNFTDGSASNLQGNKDQFQILQKYECSLSGKYKPASAPYTETTIVRFAVVTRPRSLHTHRRFHHEKHDDEASLKVREETMGATVAFTDMGGLAGASLPQVSELEDQQLYQDSEISSEYCFEGIIGQSPAIRNVLEQVCIVAPTDATVLLHGETGTGKELVAHAIHNLSSRARRNFVRMNCAAIPSGLLESELFGHEKGAFTGALMQKKGRFEIADQGTLFLDEIGDISLELQPKLLRAVQEQEFERLGSSNTISVNVRIIVATHRDLPAMIMEEKFREDLFYRFNVFPIEIPPLRERREDIPLLVNYFVSKFSRRMGRQISSIPKATMEALTNNEWPGNVRELANFIERAVILSRGEELQVPMGDLLTSYPRTVSEQGATFREAERQVIIAALIAASGRVAGNGGAAERLGLKRTTLQNKMRQLGIQRTLYAN